MRGPAVTAHERFEHDHFVRDVCGTVFDIHLARVSSRVDARRSRLEGRVVSGCEIRLRGHCAPCRRAP